MATSQPPTNPPPSASAKLALRDQVTTARRRLAVAEIGVYSRALAGHLLHAPEVRRAATVAAYVSIGSEPGTSWLLDGLLDAGTRVVVPVLLPDGDLDWAAYAGSSSLEPGPLGLLQPTGRRLGVETVAGADAVLVPGLAVSATGLRHGPRRRFLRPRAGAGAGRHLHVRGCSTTTRPTAPSRPSRTTGRWARWRPRRGSAASVGG